MLRFSKSIALALVLSVLSSWAHAQTLVAWGDSLTAGAGGTPWTSTFTSLSGIPTINRGVGGQTSTQIASRFFAEPLLHDEITVIWSGRNNWWETQTVISDIESMVAELSGPYFILGVINGSYSGIETIGQPNYNNILALNSSLESIYGSRFIDIREILVNAYNPSLPQDLTDFTNDVPPSSLRADQIHLNTAGYSVVANAVYAAYTAIPEPSSFAALFGLAALAAAHSRRRRQSLSR